ncbi:MAG: tRNA (N(6)-L-threonylcarbamoyladenosine(37)-C(2))-methylthiotransferase MtaB [Rhizobiales bacterium 65-9]|nr:tRNA (N(6)-L-threonylcarbamoyladenosine(37)-C(2))-methylthiotransferase MtaB [Hyphomicrobiales bacterium]OJY36560.1 MAG: tRNA (N(6)-L-threonylcarbamoyladenosine(37)-C(2))-methylthiotransferase MtaB [Rhizobiales bacterium 65-9]
MAVDVLTFGCRLNIHESEAMRRAAEAAGRDNLIIVNTCAVTAEATRQARQAIRRMRRERPDATIVATGCAAQIEPDAFAAMPEVDRVIGNAEKMRADAWRKDAPETVRAFGLDVSARIAVSDIMEVRDTAPFMLDAFEQHTRAFIKAQDGCDHRCTFCIIPYGRGPSRSVPMGAIVDQVRRLASAGVKEVVLTGVDVTSYGADLPGAPTLGALVAQILKHVPELPRLRLSSIDVAEIDPLLLESFATETRLMPYLHLSLQAGDDLILKRMKRRHNRAQAISFCARLREIRPDIVFGADLIAGFPTETGDHFERSLQLIDECGLTHLHVFSYSPRSGTPAARMPQVAREVARERAKRLIEKGEAARRAHMERLVGRRLRVLTEANGFGRAEDFSLVKFSAPPRRGEIMETDIASCERDHLIAA